MANDEDQEDNSFSDGKHVGVSVDVESFVWTISVLFSPFNIFSLPR